MHLHFVGTHGAANFHHSRTSSLCIGRNCLCKRHDTGPSRQGVGDTMAHDIMRAYFRPQKSAESLSSSTWVHMFTVMACLSSGLDSRAAAASVKND
jgi:hypothetical protein